MSNQSVYDQVWSLVEGLSPRTSKLVAYDGYGEVSPVINGVFLWDIVSQRCNEMTLPTEVEKEYREEFEKLQWKEEYVVTKEASYSMRHNKGVMQKVSQQKGYTKFIPVLDKWTLPVKPRELGGQDKERLWESLMDKVKEEYFATEKEAVKQQVWQEWLDLATQ